MQIISTVGGGSIMPVEEDVQTRINRFQTVTINQVKAYNTLDVDQADENDCQKVAE